jgi:ADP-dependent NAD(P)H-hydrate dehydratase
MAGRSACLDVTAALLRRWPLPQPDEAADKEARGRVLVVGGSRETPGGVLLAATAALRAGAGKLQIGVGASLALPVALAIPESRVFALPESAHGEIAPTAAAEIAERAARAQAVLVGPGMIDETSVVPLVRALVPAVAEGTLVLDAAALACLAADPKVVHSLAGRAVLTPHAGEMAHALGVDAAVVRGDALATAQRVAAAWQAVVVLKGAVTYVAAPGGETYRNRTGNVGLATSGSGDTLAGIVAGLAARGAPPLQAAVWGVYLHSRAGDRLARRVGPLGFLARELLAEVPALMAELGRPSSARGR